MATAIAEFSVYGANVNCVITAAYFVILTVFKVFCHTVDLQRSLFGVVLVHIVTSAGAHFVCRISQKHVDIKKSAQRDAKPARWL